MSELENQLADKKTDSLTEVLIFLGLELRFSLPDSENSKS